MVERSLGSIPTADVAKNVTEFYQFVKVSLPGSVFVRYTNKPGGFVGNIDGSTQTWIEYDFKLGAITFRQDRVADVSWIEFGAIDNTWNNYALNTGLEFREIVIYEAWFDATTHALTDKFFIYKGRLDLAEYRQQRLRVSIVPPRSVLSKFIGRIIGPDCGYIYKDPDTCAYAGGLASCDHTLDGPNGCRVHGQQARFGGWIWGANSLPTNKQGGSY